MVLIYTYACLTLSSKFIGLNEENIKCGVIEEPPISHFLLEYIVESTVFASISIYWELNKWYYHQHCLRSLVAACESRNTKNSGGWFRGGNVHIHFRSRHHKENTKNADTMKAQIDDNNDPMSSPFPPSNVLVVRLPGLLIFPAKHRVQVKHDALNFRARRLSFTPSQSRLPHTCRQLD